MNLRFLFTIKTQTVYNVYEKEDSSMASVATQIRIDSKVKEQATAIFHSLGLDMSSAVNIFLRYCVVYGGLPFEVRIPNYNQEVLEALMECRNNSGDDSVPGYDNMSDLKDSLMSDK